MDAHSADFDKIFKLKLNKLPRTVEKRYDFCYECNIEKSIDNVNVVYVCEQCGDVTNNDYLKIITALPPKDAYLKTIIRYNRMKNFRNYVSKKNIEYALEESVMFRVVKVNCFFKKITTRHNLIKYDYIILKILDLLKIKDPKIKNKFTMPKRKRTITKYDKIWKKVCNEYNWRYKQTKFKKKKKRKIYKIHPNQTKISSYFNKTAL